MGCEQSKKQSCEYANNSPSPNIRNKQKKNKCNKHCRTSVEEHFNPPQKQDCDMDILRQNQQCYKMKFSPPEYKGNEEFNSILNSQKINDTLQKNKVTDPKQKILNLQCEEVSKNINLIKFELTKNQSEEFIQQIHSRNPLLFEEIKQQFSNIPEICSLFVSFQNSINQKNLMQKILKQQNPTSNNNKINAPQIKKKKQQQNFISQTPNYSTNQRNNINRGFLNSPNFRPNQNNNQQEPELECIESEEAIFLGNPVHISWKIRVDNDSLTQNHINTLPNQKKKVCDVRQQKVQNLNQQNNNNSSISGKSSFYTINNNKTTFYDDSISLMGCNYSKSKNKKKNLTLKLQQQNSRDCEDPGNQSPIKLPRRNMNKNNDECNIYQSQNIGITSLKYSIDSPTKHRDHQISIINQIQESKEIINDQFNFNEANNQKKKEIFQSCIQLQKFSYQSDNNQHQIENKRMENLKDQNIIEKFATTKFISGVSPIFKTNQIPASSTYINNYSSPFDRYQANKFKLNMKQYLGFVEYIEKRNLEMNEESKQAYMQTIIDDNKQHKKDLLLKRNEILKMKQSQFTTQSKLLKTVIHFSDASFLLQIQKENLPLFMYLKKSAKQDCIINAKMKEIKELQNKIQNQQQPMSPVKKYSNQNIPSPKKGIIKSMQNVVPEAGSPMRKALESSQRFIQNKKDKKRSNSVQFAENILSNSLKNSQPRAPGNRFHYKETKGKTCEIDIDKFYDCNIIVSMVEQDVVLDEHVLIKNNKNQNSSNISSDQMSSGHQSPQLFKSSIILQKCENSQNTTSHQIIDEQQNTYENDYTSYGENLHTEGEKEGSIPQHHIMDNQNYLYMASIK